MKNYVSFVCKCMIIITCVSLFVVGCTKTNKTVKEEVNKKKTEQIKKQHTTAVIPTKTTNGTIPKELDNIESHAEDMIDDISKQDWTKVNEKLSSLEKEWSIYQTMAKDAQASTDQINTFTNNLNNLKQQIQAKKQYESSLAANKVTLDAVNFMELYKPKVPTAVGKLDYYGRQIMLTSEHGDWNQAKTDSQSSIATWDTIKSSVEKINTKDAKNVSETITKLSEFVQKQDAKMVKELSQKLLDQVDFLETDFKK